MTKRKPTEPVRYRSPAMRMLARIEAGEEFHQVAVAYGFDPPQLRDALRRAWLALAKDHPESCQCRGCAAARRIS